MGAAWRGKAEIVSEYQPGDKVTIVGHWDGRKYRVSDAEEHFGTTFYRLEGLRGALFAPSSLERVKEAKSDYAQ